MHLSMKEDFDHEHRLKTERLGTEPVASCFYISFAPAIAGLFANALYNIVDGYLLDKTLDKQDFCCYGCFSTFEIGIALCVLVLVPHPLPLEALSGKKKRPNLSWVMP